MTDYLVSIVKNPRIVYSPGKHSQVLSTKKKFSSIDIIQRFDCWLGSIRLRLVTHISGHV